jgi:hypothetical protein
VGNPEIVNQYLEGNLLIKEEINTKNKSKNLYDEPKANSHLQRL